MIAVVGDAFRIGNRHYYDGLVNILEEIIKKCLHLKIKKIIYGQEYRGNVLPRVNKIAARFMTNH